MWWFQEISFSNFSSFEEIKFNVNNISQSVFQCKSFPEAFNGQMT